MRSHRRLPSTRCARSARKFIVPGRHRSVCREHTLLSHLLDHVRRHVSIMRSGPHGVLDQGQDQQCRMPFVEMIAKDFPIPQRTQEREPAEPQHHFLA